MKIFETDQDLINEKNVIEKIANGRPYRKLEKFGLDYEITGRAYIEIKCYNQYFHEKTNLIVSMIKLLKMQQAYRKLPTFLFIQYLDGLWYIPVQDIEGYIRYTGRKKREGSTNDVEHLIFVDKIKFIKFNS